MMMRRMQYPSTPPVVKNLLIINTLVFAAMYLIKPFGNWAMEYCALYYPGSNFFLPHQLITHMFMHAGFSHLFFNMFALWMFGRVLEWDLGPRRFLTFYLICGLGAAGLYLGTKWVEIMIMQAQTPPNIEGILMAMSTPSLGASGAIFGVLLAFGLMHPNTTIMLLIPPIPMRAKYFVLIYGAVELFFGISGISDGVAHFAHVGGMLFGWLLLIYWKKSGKIYY